MPEACSNGVRSAEEYSLYVTNLPVELNEAGIEKIFKTYGTVTAIIARGEFAFISYASYAEAENAIQSLDGKAPLHLRVQLRRKRAQNDAPSRPTIQDNPTDSPIQSDCPASRSLVPQNHVARMPHEYNSGHDSRLDHLYNRFSPHHYQPMGALYPPAMAPYFMPYPYDKMDYADTNALWSRGSMTMDAAGRRHVTMGRGHTSYSICEPRARIIRDLSKIYESRNPGCYRYGSDDCQGFVSDCVHCSRSATLCCAVCEVYYCSKACQTADWPKHQAQCVKVPPLVGAKAQSPKPPVEELERSLKEIVINADKLREVEVVNQKPLRRPQSLNIDKNWGVKAKEVATSAPVLGQSSVFNGDGRFVGEEIKESEPQPAAPTKPPGPEIQNLMPEKAEEIVDLPSAEAKISIDSAVENFLSSVFTQVQITSVIEPGRVFSAQKIQDAEKIAGLMEKLNENSEKFVAIDKPVIGEIYGVMYEGLLHRGLLLSLDPTIVDYIDWGTIEALDTKSFRAIGDLAVDPPRFAQFIKVSSEKAKDFGPEAVISVRKINVEIDSEIEVINVEILDEEIEQTGAEASSKIEEPPKGVEVPRNIEEPQKKVDQPQKTPEVLTKVDQPQKTPEVLRKVDEPQKTIKIQETLPVESKPPSVLTYLKVGMALVAEIADITDKSTARVVLMPESANPVFEELLNPFKEDCDKIVPTYANYSPKVGELVAVQKPEDVFWVRGYVLKNEAPVIEVASLDEGTVISQTQKIVPLVPRYNDFATFSACMSAGGALPDSVELGSVIELEVTKMEESLVEVTMKTEAAVTPGLKLRQWTPWAEAGDAVELQPGQSVPPAAPEVDAPKKTIERITLPPTAKVVIQFYRTPSLVFLRSLDPTEFERHSRLVQNVAKAALTAAPLTSLPESADYVLAQFVDENFYRAMVIATQAETKKIKVFYIDYGDVQVTSLDKLKVLPEALMAEPCCVKKVRLHGVKTVPPTPEAVEFLAGVVSDEQPFVYEYHSSQDNEDYAILTDATAGSCLNEKINHLLTPSWEREKLEKEKEKVESVVVKTDESMLTDADKLVAVDRTLTLNDIETGKLGSIGESVHALFLEPVVPGCKFVLAPESQELIVHVSSVMPELMRAYSEATQHYIPKNNELCVALFEDGNWYRGCCLQSNASEDSAFIFFLDFGNLTPVLHKNIRAMVEDFLKPEAFGCVCNVEDFFGTESEISEGVLARLQSLMVQNERVKVEIVNFDGSEYMVKLPEVRAKLVEEGLLA